MKAHIERVAVASEQKTKIELDNLKLTLELSFERQASEAAKEIRLVIWDEVHHYMRDRDGEI